MEYNNEQEIELETENNKRHRGTEYGLLKAVPRDLQEVIQQCNITLE